EDGQLHDWQILRELRRRMEAGTKREGSKDFFTQFSPAQVVDLGLKNSPYDIRVRHLRENPHGVDLGALRTAFPARLAQKTIKLAPEEIVRDMPRLRQRLADDVSDADNGFGLMLIGRRHVRTNNSWMHNSERLVRGKNRCTLMMHPDDATAHNLAEGDCVQVASRVGVVEVPVEITDTMMRGVVSLPHGYGHDREGVQLDVASAHAGVSINDLTDDQRLDELTGNAAFSGVPVKIVQ
ncbi:MAG: molybdopterin oxidoreductase family protein, partial [Chloroflexota bacterium]